MRTNSQLAILALVPHGLVVALTTTSLVVGGVLIVRSPPERAATTRHLHRTVSLGFGAAAYAAAIGGL